MVDLFLYCIFVITITFLMLIISQEHFTPLQKCFQEKRSVFVQ